MPASAEPQRLVVYSGGFEALAQQQGGPPADGYALVRRPLDVRDNALTLDDLPRGVDPATLELEADNLRVRSQRFDFAGLDQSQLLERAIGQRIRVEQDAGGQLRGHEGVLLAAGNGLTLREDDGRVRVLSAYSGFTLAAAPEGLVARPTLRLQLEGGAGEAHLSYATAGLAWRAEYRAVLSATGGACRMAWSGHAMVANRSGADFRGVQLTLVAGEPRRVRSTGAPQPMLAMASAKAMDAEAAPEVRASGEYHAYDLPGSADLPDGSLQRLPLLPPAEGLTCERRFLAESPFGGWQPDRPMVQRQMGGDGEVEVRTRLGFENARGGGRGIALPAGRVRVFDGADLLGEAELAHTAAGRRVDLDLGKSFDLSAERRSVGFELDRSGRTMTETIEWTLRNAKPDVASVQLKDRLPRWTDWSIVEGGDRFRKTDAQGIEATVELPAAGVTTVRYTVRYRWAADITID